jgi:type IV pilus assembly protein PilY1
VAENARRFYYPPDVALVSAADGPYHSIVLSSGFRAHPLDANVHDRIYMLKDRTTTYTSTYKKITEANLYNATSNLAGGDSATDAARDIELADMQSKEGWYINLDDEANPGSWLGEKGLAEPLIIGGVAILTTYTPDLNPPADSCGPTLGLGKVYFLDLLDATAAFPTNLDVRSDRHIELARGGIPPTPNVIITKGGVPTLCIGTECGEAQFGLGVRKTYWYEVN